MVRRYICPMSDGMKHPYRRKDESRVIHPPSLRGVNEHGATMSSCSDLDGLAAESATGP